MFNHTDRPVNSDELDLMLGKAPNDAEGPGKTIALLHGAFTSQGLLKIKLLKRHHLYD